MTDQPAERAEETAAGPGPTAPDPTMPAPQAPEVPAAPAAPTAPQWGTPGPAAPAAPGPATGPQWAAPAAPGPAAPPPPPPVAWAPAKAKILQFGAAAQAASGTHGLRTSIAAAVIMVGVLLTANGLNAVVPLPADPAAVNTGPAAPQQPNPAQPGATAAPVAQGPVAAGTGVDVGNGVIVHPPSGWSVVGQDQGMTAFGKGSVVVITTGLAWTDTALSLATQYRDAWFKNGQFTGENPQTGTIGSGLDGAVLNYTGTMQGNQIDGGIIAATKGGKAALLNMFGPTGSLKDVSGDLNAFITSIEITGVTQ